MRAEELIFSALGPLVGGRCQPTVVQQTTLETPRIVFDTQRNDTDFVCLGHPREDVSVTLDLTHLTFDAARGLRDQVLSTLTALTEYRSTEFDSCDFDPETKTYIWSLQVNLHCARA